MTPVTSGLLALVRLAVRCLPRDIRDDYGVEMLVIVARRCGDFPTARARRRFLIGTIVDLLREGVRARLDALRRLPGRAATGVVAAAGSDGARTAVSGLGIGAALVGLVLYGSTYGPTLLPWARDPAVRVWPDAVFTPTLLARVASQVRELEIVAAASPRRVALDGGARSLTAAVVTPGFPQLAAAEAILGSSRLGSRPGDTAAVLLSDGVWDSLYGRDPGVIGRTVRLGGTAQAVGVIDGVVTEAAGGYRQVDLWIAAPPPRAALEDDTDWAFADIQGRLRPGATMASATAALRGVAATLARDHPNLVSAAAAATATVVPARWPRRAASRRALDVAAALGLALLALAVAAARLRGRRDAADHGPAAGEGHTRSVPAAVLGAAAAAAAAVALSWLVSGSRDPLLAAEVRAGPAWLLAAAAAAIGAATTGLRRSWTGQRSGRAWGLAVLGIAGIVAGILGLAFERRTGSTGFNPAGVVAYPLAVATAVPGGFDELVAILEREEAVDRAAVVQALPLGAIHWGSGVTLAGDPTPGRPPEARLHLVTAGFFATAEVGLLSGRVPGPEEDRLSGAVVSRRFADRHGGPTAVVGRRIELRGTPLPSFEVIGVVEDIAEPAARHQWPGVYLPIDIAALSAAWLLVRGGRTAGMTVDRVLADQPRFQRDGPPVAMTSVVRQARGELLPLFQLTRVLALAALGLGALLLVAAIREAGPWRGQRTRVQAGPPDQTALAASVFPG